MRYIINLSEAPRPKAISPEERAHQEQQHRAKLIANTKAEGVALATKAQKIISEANHCDQELHTWNRDWNAEIKAIVAQIHKRDIASAKEELDYDLESDPGAVMRSVDFFESIKEGYIQWWDNKKDTIEWSDADYRLGEYMDAHRKTEQSDDMSRLQAEDELAKRVHSLGGGFASPIEMDKTLGFIDIYLSYPKTHFDGGWSHIGVTTIDLITKGIPVILMYCKTVENLKG